MSGQLRETTADELRRRVAVAQSSWRAASVVAGVSRRGERLLEHGVGLADADAGARPDGDTQYRIGSITKTFTAVMVMALRDEGMLRLDEPIGVHLPGWRHGSLTPRQLLSHLSGLQREPVGDVWWTLDVPDRDDLLEGLERAESVSSPHRRWHYSNLAYAVLGELVARLDRRPWEESLQARLLTPLDLSRTTLHPVPPRALGYLTDPYADRLLREPDLPIAGLAAAAQLWSTPRDLLRWATFLVDPAASGTEVLAAATAEEMGDLQSMFDSTGWTLGWGLGLMLYRDADRLLVGHEGGMPGFVSGLYVHRESKVAAVVLVNSSSGADPGRLAVELVGATLDAEPEPPEPWTPGEPPGTDVEPLLGRWWSEGSEFVFTWTGGRLEARVAVAPRTRPPAVFAPEGGDRWRTVSGREAGEQLRVVRRPDGSVVRLHWATYGFTREPRVFGATPEDDDTYDGR